MDRLKIYDTVDQLCEGFSLYLKELLEDKTFNICLSGGSTPKSLFQYWSDKYNEKIPWHKINFFWGDERCVPPNHEDSNYGMTSQYLFKNIQIPEKNIFRIRGEDNPDQEAGRYGNIIQEHVPHNGNVPQFDLVILGLGDDGHTASIFPHQINFWNSKNNCIKAEHPVNHQTRISITGKIINNAKNVAFLVTGKKKAKMIKKVALRKKLFADNFPAAKVDPYSGNLLWFLDSDAASKL